MDILHEALVALNDWVEDGCPKHPAFKRDIAICGNIEGYIEYRCYDYQDAYEELGKIFKKEGLDKNYPFNGGRMDNYEEEVILNEEAWQNPKRLAWLKKHGRRTISDCIPFFSKTPNPEISIIVNVYQKNGRWWAIPDVWRYHKQLGAVKVDDNSLRHQIYLDLNARGVAIEGFNCEK